MHPKIQLVDQDSGGCNSLFNMLSLYYLPILSIYTLYYLSLLYLYIIYFTKKFPSSPPISQLILYIINKIYTVAWRKVRSLNSGNSRWYCGTAEGRWYRVQVLTVSRNGRVGSAPGWVFSLPSEGKYVFRK